MQRTTVLSAEEAARLEMDLEWMCGHGAVEVLEDAVLLDSEEYIAAVEFEDGRAAGTAVLYARPEYPRARRARRRGVDGRLREPLCV